jgi:predicted DCC family thiol-disulfide oxidoreductase YuxK
MGILGVLPTRLLDFGYGFVARRRYGWFGRYDACVLPPPEQRSRFIDI